MGDTGPPATGHYAKEPGELTQSTPSTSAPRPVAVTIAGSDCSGGAGIQADLKTFMVHGVYGASVITALTAQNTQGMRGVHIVPAHFVALQLEAVFADLDVKSVKTGMLASAGTVEAICDVLARRWSGPLVVDPVMVATSGDQLVEPDAIEVVRQKLLPLAALVMPNLAEAAVLSGQSVAGSIREMELQGRLLLDLGPKAVLVKGGHCSWGDEEAVDILVTASGVEMFSSKRLKTPHTHGSGCTLSAAVSANLSVGHGLECAGALAKSFVSAGIAGAAERPAGRGRGPLVHLVGLDVLPRSTRRRQL